MFSRTALADVAELHAPAPEALLERIQEKLGLEFPREYRELLRCTNGIEPTTNDDCYAISLFPLEELAEFQTAYGIADSLPGYLLIGFDGGCRGLFLKSGSQSPLFLSETSAFGVSELRRIADGMSHWIALKFDLGDPPEEPLPERIDVHLIKRPAGGLKQLRAICQKFGLQVRVAELRELWEKIPLRIGHELPFRPYQRLAEELNLTEPCLTTTKVDASTDHPL